MTSTSRAFCPRCGETFEPREDAPGGLRDDERVLCDDCYFEDFALVDAPESLSVPVCTRCGAVHRGNRWIDVGAEDYTDVAVDAVADALAVHETATDVDWGVTPEQIDQNTIRMHCEFHAVVRDRTLSASATVPVTFDRGTCKRCGRIAGDYFAGIVQVRATDRVPTDEELATARDLATSLVADLEADGDRNAFVSDVTEKPEGLDVKVSTNRIGQRIASRLVDEFGGSYSSAETLVTEDGDGNEVYRVTFPVRLPRYVTGDVIATDDGPVVVEHVQTNVRGRRLTTGDAFEEPLDAVDADRVGSVEDAVETTVVTVEDDRAVQVLDPDTFETVTIDRPSYVDEDADTVRVVKLDGSVYALPAP